MSLVVGLTGGIACGKTTVATLFSECGIDVIDTDLIARDVVAPGSPGLQAITAQFGSDLIGDNGELDRRQLRKMIFAAPEAKQWLETLLHPLIRKQCELAVNHSKSPYAILAIPLLYETWPHPLVNRVLVVDCEQALQWQRLVERDHISPELATQMLTQQATREQRLSIADDVIENNMDLTTLAQRVQALHKCYLSLI